MKLTSKDLLELKIIDEIIPEPNGGAHRDKNLILFNIKDSIQKNLDYLTTKSRDEIISLKIEYYLTDLYPSQYLKICLFLEKLFHLYFWMF